MHPSGFDTRAIISDEVSLFLASTGPAPENERLHEILDTNSFKKKIEFVKEILGGWIQWGRLGGRPRPSGSSSTVGGSDADSNDGNPNGCRYPIELFWEGVQEKTWAGAGGGKFVWVTVGAQGGDGEYISVSLRGGDEPGDRDGRGEALRERLLRDLPR
jgi:hypothetical protein